MNEYGPKSLPSASTACSKPAKNEDDVDLFDSEEETEEEKQRKAENLAKYHAKKAAKGPGPAAKSSVVLDVKPWDDTTDMNELEKHVRAIAMDGLFWGASQMVPVGYGIRKLRITAIVEDEKVGVDVLEEAITGIEDYVQSMDIFSFNKI